MCDLEQPEYCTNEFRMYGFKVSERERERAAAAVTATGETLTHAKAAKTDQICLYPLKTKPRS